MAIRHNLKFRSCCWMALLLCCSLTSCDFITSVFRRDKIVASACGENLTEAELYRNLDMTGLNSSDSADAIDMYIKSWASDRVMYELSRDEVSEESNKEIDSLVENYRQSLYVYEYELQLIRDHLSSQITDEQVSAYYKENPSLFYLQEPLLKGVAVTILNRSSDFPVLKLLMESPGPSMDMIESLCVKSAAKFDYFNDNWTLLSDIQKRCTLPIHEVEFKDKTLYSESDSIHTLFLYVNNSVLSGDMQPFDFAKNRIRSILTEQKKNEFLRSYRSKLYENGVNNGSVKRY